MTKSVSDLGLYLEGGGGWLDGSFHWYLCCLTDTHESYWGGAGWHWPVVTTWTNQPPTMGSGSWRQTRPAGLVGICERTCPASQVWSQSIICSQLCLASTYLVTLLHLHNRLTFNSMNEILKQTTKYSSTRTQIQFYKCTFCARLTAQNQEYFIGQ